MHGCNSNGSRIIAFHVESSVFLSGNVLDALGSTGPNQKDNTLLLAFDIFGRYHPKVEIGFQL